MKLRPKTVNAPPPHEPLPPAPYGVLRKPSAQVDLAYIEKLRALYRGGKALLANDRIMSQVFPKHANESNASYRERRDRAFYENIFAQVVNKIAAGLAQDPTKLAPADPADPDAPAPTKPGAPDEEGPKLDDYWTSLQRDATPPNDDGRAQTLDEIVRAVCGEALVAGRSWVLCDMPPPTIAGSLREQEDSGALYAYPILYRADQVLAWYEEKGVLQWVRSYSCSRPAPNPLAPAALTRHEFTIWTRSGWTRYAVTVDANNQIFRDGIGTREVLKDETLLIPGPDDDGPHSFERVPWVCFDCQADDEPTMWIGDLIESQVRNYFNQSCGDAYQRLRHMYQQLYEFLGTELDSIDNPISDAQANPNRAKTTKRGPDIVQVRGKDDSAEFVAPNMDGAAINQQQLKDGRDGIMRVTGQLALSQDTSGAMLRRSGDSKKQDKIEELVVLGAVGKKLLGFVRQLVMLLAAGRKDATRPFCSGYENFDVDGASDVIASVVELEAISIPSARFQVELKLRAAVAALGDNVDSSIRNEIREQLEKTITQESFTMTPDKFTPGAPGEDDGDEDGPDDDDEPAGGDAKPPGKKPPPGKGAAS